MLLFFVSNSSTAQDVKRYRYHMILLACQCPAAVQSLLLRVLPDTLPAMRGH